MTWMEWIGIAATCLVLISFMQKSEANIRKINMVGSVLFVIYGVLINSLSVWLLNGICILVNLYKLLKNRQRVRAEHASMKVEHQIETKLASADEYQKGYASGYEHGYDDGFNALYKSSHYAEVISEGKSIQPAENSESSHNL